MEIKVLSKKIADTFSKMNCGLKTPEANRMTLNAQDGTWEREIPKVDLNALKNDLKAYGLTICRLEDAPKDFKDMSKFVKNRYFVYNSLGI